MAGGTVTARGLVRGLRPAVGATVRRQWFRARTGSVCGQCRQRGTCGNGARALQPKKPAPWGYGFRGRRQPRAALRSTCGFFSPAPLGLNCRPLATRPSPLATRHDPRSPLHAPRSTTQHPLPTILHPATTYCLPLLPAPTTCHPRRHAPNMFVSPRPGRGRKAAHSRP